MWVLTQTSIFLLQIPNNISRRWRRKVYKNGYKAFKIGLWCYIIYEYFTRSQIPYLGNTNILLGGSSDEIWKNMNVTA